MKVLSNQSVFVDLSPCAEADTRGSLGQLLRQESKVTTSWVGGMVGRLLGGKRHRRLLGGGVPWRLKGVGVERALQTEEPFWCSLPFLSHNCFPCWLWQVVPQLWMMRWWWRQGWGGWLQGMTEWSWSGDSRTLHSRGHVCTQITVPGGRLSDHLIWSRKPFPLSFCLSSLLAFDHGPSYDDMFYTFYLLACLSAWDHKLHTDGGCGHLVIAVSPGW